MLRVIFDQLEVEKMVNIGEVVSSPMVLFPLSIAAASVMTFMDHKRIFSTLIVGTVLFGLFATFFLLEIVFLILTPYRLLTKKAALSADEAAAEASGKRDKLKRRIVVFDGVCVLCNRAGQFVVSHLPDPNLVSFVPFQDALANPHVNLAKLREEFPDFRDEQLEERICVVSGERMLWGADAVMEVCSWMHAPFPIIKFGWVIPRPLRDVIYMTVSSNRYDWFGTQPLDRNFSKSLCPYLQVRKFLEIKKTE